jgi:hypothetical protein
MEDGRWKMDDGKDSAVINVIRGSQFQLRHCELKGRTDEVE